MSLNFKQLTSIAAIALLASTTACSDSTMTAPMANPSAPAFAKPVPVNNKSRVLSSTKIGDTTVTVFVVGTATTSTSSFALGNFSSIAFAGSASSICNLSTSSYGPTSWDSSCSASSSSVQITAKTWRNAQGRTESDFQPAMRFVPLANKAVTLSLWDGTNGSGIGSNARIDFRASNGALVNEASTDWTLMSIYNVSMTSMTSTTTTSSSTSSTTEGTSASGTDASSGSMFAGIVTRRIKHFSGYTVTAD